MSKAKKPVVGDTVHYVAPGAHRAAIVIGIVDAEGDPVNLAVFADGSAWGAGPYQSLGVFYDEELEQGTWHWPEKA